MAREKRRVIQWTKLGSIKIKGLIGRIDPTKDLDIRVRNYIDSEKRKHNQTINNTFELEEGQFTKYEFFWNSPASVSDGNEGHLFDMECYATVIYAKPKSILFFQTQYDICIKRGCNPWFGSILATGGTDFQMEEIFYQKVNSLQATHEEKQYELISGCMGNPAPKTEYREGFKIRTYENFQVYDDNPNELNACRKDINQRIQEYT